MRQEDDDLLPLPATPGKRRVDDAHEQRHGGDLGRGGEEGGDRRRRALVDVGRPHVERHRRDLEGEADEQEHEAEDQADVLAGAGRALRDGGDAGEARRAGEAVDQRGAVEQHARRQRAEHEVLEAGLARARRRRGGRRRRRRAPGSAARGRGRARSGRWPRPSSSCRRSQQASTDTRAAEVIVELCIADALLASRRSSSNASISERPDRAPAERQHQQLHEAAEGVDDEGAVEGDPSAVLE